jgi:hypothetical protein
MTDENKILIILGMHRSGTSLITHWLQCCGLEIGAELMGPSVGNVEGHFEDIDFFEVHKQILKDNKIADSGISCKADLKIKPEYKNKIKKLITEKNQRFSQWGWKEPRTCLFLDVYHEMLPDAYYFVIFRDFQLVVTSLIKREFADRNVAYSSPGKGFFSKLFWHKIKKKGEFARLCRRRTEYFLRVWLFYNEKLLTNLKVISPDKYLVLNYDMLNKKDKEVTDVLIDKWNFSLKHFSFSNIFKKDLFSETFNIESFIKDKELISKAESLTANLMSFMPA